METPGEATGGEGGEASTTSATPLVPPTQTASAPSIGAGGGGPQPIYTSVTTPAPKPSPRASAGMVAGPVLPPPPLDHLPSDLIEATFAEGVPVGVAPYLHQLLVDVS